MDVILIVTPAGGLRCESPPVTGEATTAASQRAAIPAELATALIADFAESTAAGLLRLARPDLAITLPPEFVFWRAWTLRLLARVTHLDEQQFAELGSGKSVDVPPPDAVQRQSLAAEAPPMRGLEYLTADTLAAIWNGLIAALVDRAKSAKGGLAAVIHDINPHAHLVGRVTFHLAENRRDPANPFAFLATYANRVSSRSRLTHLPLGEALRQYADQQDHDKLAELLAPVRAAATDSAVVRELLDSRALFRPQAWTIRQAHRFLREVPKMEQAGLVVRVPDWWHTRKSQSPKVQVRIGDQATSALGLGGLMDFSADLVVGGEPLTEEERQSLLDSGEQMMLLRGRWVEVDREKLLETLEHWQRLRKAKAGGIDFIAGMRLLAGESGSNEEADDDDVRQWTGVIAGEWLAKTLEQLRDPTQIDGCRPGKGLQATLRPYQVDGVRWLWFITRLGLGGCLADDMGLGKTIQVIDLILRLAEQSKGDQKSDGAAAEPHLLVVPASLVSNWKQELARFAPQLRVLVAHRSETESAELDKLARSPARVLAAYDVVITTYHVVRTAKWPLAVSWTLAVIDEAQAIKNPGSGQSKAVRKLSAGCRIALTGTPVENQLADLWSLFDFCCPGLLGTMPEFSRFVKGLDRRQDAGAYASLRRLVQPYVLRRMKTDPTVIADLPEKTETAVDCGLTRKQATLYEKYLADVAKLIESADGIQRRGIVLAMLTRLKQLCNHPDAFLGRDAYQPNQSGKFIRLAELCEPIVERQEKALVFTQFQSLCEPLADYLESRFGRTALILHGGVPVRKRANLVKRFQTEETTGFFVISVKAGGTGLNLTAASHVIHFDRWWNPAVENQATDRAYRIGQQKNVLVHKFVCRGTVEERIDQMIRDKQALAEEILGEGGEKMLTEMNDEDLLRFISLDINRATVDG